MPITYQDNTLFLVPEQTGGNGVEQEYQNDQGERFSIKTPANQCELFAELFASRILQEFIKEKLIDNAYIPSLVVSDVIEFEDGSYRLIQPIINCQKLHQQIGTSTFNGSDRNALLEAARGPSYYATINNKNERSFGLSLTLMYSLLLGAHSVHSGNIVVLRTKEHLSKQYARIDWSDAFRNFAKPENNTEILYASENRGWLNYKGYTKDYFLNYKLIPGLFPAMAKKATELKESLTDSTLLDIVNSALKNIPKDFIGEEIKKQFASYIGIDSFSTLSFDPKYDSDQFASEMAKTLKERLDKIAQLQDIVTASATTELYESTVVTPALTLSINSVTPFPQLLTEWSQLLSENKKVSPESIQNMDLSQLALSFNAYIKELAKQSDEANIWEHNEGSENMFARLSTTTNGGLALHGHAFVAEYREGTIFRNLVSLHPERLGTLRFAPYEPFIEGHANTFPKWAKMQKLATFGHSVFNTLRYIKKGLNYGMEGFMEENLPTLQKTLEEFIQLKSEVEVFLNQSDEKITSNLNSSPFFYPLDDNALNAKTGDQLVTICFEGLDELEPNFLVTRILKNDSYWSMIEQSLKKDSYNGREDNFQEKKKKIIEWRNLLENNAVLEQKRIDEYKLNQDRLKNQLKKTLQEISNFKASIKAIKEERSKLENKITELKQKVKDETDSCAEIIKKNNLEKEKEKEQQINQLTTTLSQLKTANSELEISKKSMEQKQQHIEQQNKTILSQQGQILELNRQLDALKKPKTSDEPLLQEKGDIRRAMKVAPIQTQLDKLQLKAKNMEERKQEATEFIDNMNKEINNYIYSKEDESTALTTFKENSNKFIKQVETTLGEHREEWKYILVNLSLLVLSLGVGYLIASLINKGINDRYTFFSVSESEEILDKLKDRTQSLGN